MRFLKIGLTAMLAAMALMAYVGVGTASAAELYKDINWALDETQGSGVTFTATLESNTTALFETTDNKAIETCTGSELEFKIANAGENTSTILNPNGSFQKHTYTGCNNVKVLGFGNWEITNIKGTNGGSVYTSGTEFTVNIPFVGSCVVTTNQTYIGTLTGAKSETDTATLDMNGALTVKGAAGCPPTARWTSSYTVTNLNGLYVLQK